MHTNLTTFAECLFGCTKKPTSELCSSVFVFYLLVVFHVITNNEVWSFAFPHCTTNLLFCTTSNYPKPVSIIAFDNDLSFLITLKSNDSKFSAQILIVVQLITNVGKLLYCLVLCATDQYHVVTS